MILQDHMRAQPTCARYYGAMVMTTDAGGQSSTAQQYKRWLMSNFIDGLTVAINQLIR